MGLIQAMKLGVLCPSTSHNMDNDDDDNKQTNCNKGQTQQGLNATVYGGGGGFSYGEITFASGSSYRMIIGQGGMGGASNRGGGGGGGPVLESQIVISQNYTFTSNTNGLSVSPVTVAAGYSVTVGTGQAWMILG